MLLQSIFQVFLFYLETTAFKEKILPFKLRSYYAQQDRKGIEY